MARLRLTSPLYDTRQWVRDYETAIALMWEQHVAGSAPHALVVARRGKYADGRWRTQAAEAAAAAESHMHDEL